MGDIKISYTEKMKFSNIFELATVTTNSFFCA